MLKIIARIIPVIIWSLVLGCGRHSDNTDDCPVITINQSDIVEKIDLADVSESNLVFKPETTDASLISRICRVWHYKSCVYILDSSYQLLVFSETGKYLWKLDKRGSGPGEYSRLMDFAIDPTHDQLLLLCYDKILRYDLNGNYIDNVKTDDGYEISADGKYAYIKSFDQANGETIPFSLKIIDLKSLTVADALPAETDCAPSCMSKMQMLTFSGGKVLFSRKFDSKIYSLSDDSESAVFNINWGECAFPNTSDKKYDCEEFFKLSSENNYIYSIGDIIMSDSLCFFKTNLNSYGLIDRTVNTMKVAKRVTDTRLFPDMPIPLKLIPVDGDLPEIAAVITPSSAKFFALKCKDSNIANILETMDKEDNPVLILSVLK